MYCGRGHLAPPPPSRLTFRLEPSHRAPPLHISARHRSLSHLNMPRFESRLESRHFRQFVPDILETPTPLKIESLPPLKQLRELNLSYVSRPKKTVDIVAQTLRLQQAVMESLTLNIGMETKEAKKLGSSVKVNQSLTELDLSLNDCGDEGAAAIVKSIGAKHKLKKLNLAGNQAGAQCAAALAKMLLTNKSIHSLYLYHNQLGNQEAVQICASLKQNKTVQILSLADNGISSAGANHMLRDLCRNVGLRSLNLSGNQIGDESLPLLEELVKTHPTLERLNLKNNAFSAPRVTEFLLNLEKRNPKLTIVAE